MKLAPMSEQLPEGLYESVLDRALEVRLDALVGLDQEVATVDPAEHTHVLARHLSEAVAQRLGAEKDPVRKLALANDILRFVQDTRPRVDGPLRQLHAIRRPPGPGPARHGPHRQRHQTGRLRADAAQGGSAVHPRAGPIRR